MRQRTGPANVRTRARPILTCTRKPLRKLLYLASSDRRGCLAGPRRTAALAMRSCRAAQSQTTRADQGGHLRVERPLCGVRMRDSAVGGEGCCCADKGRSHVIMEDSVLFSSLPGRHGGVHSHRQPDQRPPVRDLQHARHTHEAHTDLSTRQHRGANAPWRAWVVGSPARRSHVSMPFWTSTSSRLSLAIVLPAPPPGSSGEPAEAARRRSTTLIWEQVTAELSTVMPLAQPMPPRCLWSASVSSAVPLLSGAVEPGSRPKDGCKVRLVRPATRATAGRPTPNLRACSSSTMCRQVPRAVEPAQRADRHSRAAPPPEGDGQLPREEQQRAPCSAGPLQARRSRGPCARLRHGAKDAARPRASRRAQLRRGAWAPSRPGTPPASERLSDGSGKSVRSAAVGRGGSTTAPAPPRRPLLGSLTRVRRMFTVQHSLRNRPPKSGFVRGHFQNSTVGSLLSLTEG